MFALISSRSGSQSAMLLRWALQGHHGPLVFLSQSSPDLYLFSFDKITLKSYICTVVTVMAKQCWSQTVLESGSWGHSVLQTPALVSTEKYFHILWVHNRSAWLRLWMAKFHYALLSQKKKKKKKKKMKNKKNRNKKHQPKPTSIECNIVI